MIRSHRILALLLTGLCLAGCASQKPATHGRLTELSRVDGPIVLCEHKVPEQVCTRHHPELEPQFKRAGDWCPPHQVPESQCLVCHPDLTFEPLPALPESADVQWLSKQGEDVRDIEGHAVKGKVTIFEFSADWCAACRKVDGHLYTRLQKSPQALAYRRLNIVSWESPLAQRYLQEVPSLPLLWVFGPDGRPVQTLHGAQLEALDKAIDQALSRSGER